jgi:outer membrane receptor protein involved in Fe transport
MAGVLLLTSPARAQVTTGAIVGTVTDSSGAAIPNAVVTIVNTQTAIKRNATSSGLGEFGVNLLEPGNYNVTVTAAGFKKFEVTGLTLDVGRTERVTAALTLGAAMETVTVTGDVAASLQTDSATVQASIDTKSVQDLPLNGRNFVNLVQQTPGVNPGNPSAIAGGGHPDDRRDSSAVSANGQGSEFNNQQVDGLDNNERQQGVIAVRPSIDAISEVRVLTNNFPAEVGRAAGAVVDVVTKAGGNQFHGSAFEFFRNDIFDARDFFAKAGQEAKPELRQNEFGGSVGGPIWKNKTFFFAAYEGQRRIGGITHVSTVPTAYEEANPGDFSDIGGPVAPMSALNPIALDLYTMYPAPNATPVISGGIPTDNFVYSPKATLYSTNVDARVDHHFNDNNTLFFHYSYNPTNTYTPTGLPPVQAHGLTVANTGADNFSDSFGDIAGPSMLKAQGIYADFVHIFTPKLAMEVKAGFTRLVIKSNTQNFGENVSDAFGFPNSNLGTPDTTGLANILFFSGPYASLGDSYFEPLYDTNNIPQVNGSVTYTHGAHNIKIGAAFIKRELNYFVDPFSPQGGFAYFGITGNPMLDFLEGADLFSLRGNLLTKPGFRTSEPSAFIQDDWRVTPTLTVNLGLRYDIFTPFTEAHNNYSNFNRVTGVVDIAGQGTSSTLGVKTDYKDFQPRLGFAKQLPNSTVVRGGYSMVYFPVDYQNVIQNPNPPYTFECIGCANSFAAFPNLPNPVGPSTTNPAGTLFYKDPHFQASYMHMYNMAVEKQIGNNTFTVGYVGELQVKQLYQGDLNRPANVVTNVPTSSGTPPPPPAYNYAALDPNAQDITYDYNGAHGNYNALQASVVRRAGKGLTFFANYTWAHGLSNGITEGTTTDETGLVPRNPNYDYGDTDFNIRNRFAGSVNWQIPFGQTLNGIKRTALYGWQTNLLSFWQTGLPETVSSGAAAINLPDVTGDRPDQIADNHVASPSIGEWFNTSAYRVQQFYGQAGTERVNSVYGPHDRRVDFSLFKNFQMYRESNLQFRAEIFNVSNTPNFGQPDIGLQDPNFGKISSTRPNEFPRQIQFALKYNF